MAASQPARNRCRLSRFYEARKVAQSHQQGMNALSPFFIVGCPRSGTTLLSVLLDRNSRLCVPPETAFYDEVAPFLAGNDNALLFNILQRWRRLSELRIDPHAVLRSLQGQALSSSTVLAAILNLYAADRRKERCGEKTPQHLRHVPTILQEFPDAKILCMLRDGREVALSLNAMPWWSPQSAPSWAPAWWMRRRLLRAARLWQQCLALTLRFSREYSQQFRVFRYEELIARPAEIVASATEFLGATFEAGQIDPAVPSDLVLRRSTQWKGHALQNIEADGGGRRRHAATVTELAILERVLRNELALAGYSL